MLPYYLSLALCVCLHYPLVFNLREGNLFIPSPLLLSFSTSRFHNGASDRLLLPDSLSLFLFRCYSLLMMNSYRILFPVGRAFFTPYLANGFFGGNSMIVRKFSVRTHPLFCELLHYGLYFFRVMYHTFVNVCTMTQKFIRLSPCSSIHTQFLRRSSSVIKQQVQSGRQ